MNGSPFVLKEVAASNLFLMLNFLKSVYYSFHTYRPVIDHVHQLSNTINGISAFRRLIACTVNFD
jgi:hypothetical protein